MSRKHRTYICSYVFNPIHQNLTQHDCYPTSTNRLSFPACYGGVCLRYMVLNVNIFLELNLNKYLPKFEMLKHVTYNPVTITFLSDEYAIIFIMKFK